MNRQEASKNIGSTVLIDQGKEGMYYGTLEEVYTPPQKTWSGEVKVSGLFELPDIEHAKVLDEMKNRSVVVPGTKIHLLPEPSRSLDYNASVHSAAESAADELQSYIDDYSGYAEQWREIAARFGGASKKTESTNKAGNNEKNQYVYYRIERKDGTPFLHEPTYGDELELEGCPFEFEVQKDSSWITVSHDHGFVFKDAKKRTISLQTGDFVRIHQEQFQPFTILLNELEHPSRKSFLQDIEDFGFTKTDLADCHNRLLYELLQAEGNSSFKGVNFLTFQKPGKTLLVQHHYERKLKSQAQDYVYDRFEYTADNGERRISTYTSAYTKDHES
ncbi:DUF2777 family protein [Salibacterium aidingense]|uniref:DUF2777 family protein n=1 Tax=Salibacterium aidingense TaxID=384933 RepID=UPI003BE71B7A